MIVAGSTVSLCCLLDLLGAILLLVCWLEDLLATQPTQTYYIASSCTASSCSCSYLLSSWQLLLRIYQATSFGLQYSSLALAGDSYPTRDAWTDWVENYFYFFTTEFNGEVPSPENAAVYHHLFPETLRFEFIWIFSFENPAVVCTSTALRLSQPFPNSRSEIQNWVSSHLPPSEATTVYNVKNTCIMHY